MRYRIEGEEKFYKFSDGSEGCEEATTCEIQLWAERAEMIAALKSAKEFIEDIQDYLPDTPDNITQKTISKCVSMLARAEGETK